METAGQEVLSSDQGKWIQVQNLHHLFRMCAKSVLGYLSSFIKQQSYTVFSGACTFIPLHPSTAPSYPAEGTHRVEFCADNTEHLDTVLSKIKGIQGISCLTTLPARYLLHSLMYSFCCLK